MRDEDPQVFQDRDAAWDNESLRADREPDAAAAEDRSRRSAGARNSLDEPGSPK